MPKNLPIHLAILLGYLPLNTTGGLFEIVVPGEEGVTPSIVEGVVAPGDFSAAAGILPQTVCAALNAV